MSDDFKSEISRLCLALKYLENTQEQVQSMRRTIDNAINNGKELKDLKTWTEEVWIRRIDGSLDGCYKRVESVKDSLITKRDEQARQ